MQHQQPYKKLHYYYYFTVVHLRKNINYHNIHSPITKQSNSQHP